MIFSLLNVRKKTAATLAGIAIGAACLWGLSMWQDISIPELARTLLALVVLLAAIMFAAFLVIAVFKLLSRIIKRLGTARDSDHQA